MKKIWRIDGRITVVALAAVLLAGVLFAFVTKRLPWQGNFLRFRQAANRNAAASEITFIEVEALRSGAQDRFLFVDARPPLFFQRGHIPGALNIAKQFFVRDFGASEAALRGSALKQIVVYCSSEDCDDALTVARELIDTGVRNVAVFKGGWKAWCTAGLPQK